jgi:hypothetical protein
MSRLFDLCCQAGKQVDTIALHFYPNGVIGLWAYGVWLPVFSEESIIRQLEEMVESRKDREILFRKFREVT